MSINLTDHNLKWIDVHTHLEMLEGETSDVLKRAKLNGVEQVVNIGTCSEDLPKVLATAQKFYPVVACTLGVHPHDAKDFDKARGFIQSHYSEKEVVALGEMGLDYYYEHSDRLVQQKVFEEQLQWSVDWDLPVEIHTRDAEEDTLNMLKKFNGKVTGILHCFTGSTQLAEEALALGLNISVSGVCTFKKAESLRETLRIVPLERMHLETDAPFLAPTPQRGKKNEPAFVMHTAHFLAELKKVSLEDLSSQMKLNTYGLFKKLPVII